MPKMLVTGGAGFIGMNTALWFREAGWAVAILDNFSRPGSELNHSHFGRGIGVARIDVREYDTLARHICAGKYDVIIHLAGQVAVSQSTVDPRGDFTTNVVGTFNVLEAVRRWSPETHVVFASTNKVYGDCEDLGVHCRDNRWVFPSGVGVTLKKPLDFLGPYGCSKGAAEQYVLDYARSFGLTTTVVRQSCIYGPMQLGTEDQGWITWFGMARLFDDQITVYGDGMQTRDVLRVDRLVDLYRTIVERRRTGVVNAGGGMENVVSVREVLDKFASIAGRGKDVKYAKARVGDQRAFYFDTADTEESFGWWPGAVYSYSNNIDMYQDTIKWLRDNEDYVDAYRRLVGLKVGP